MNKKWEIKYSIVNFSRKALILWTIFWGANPVIIALEKPVKDLVRITTLRENQVSGYGVVIGLPQTGDSRSQLAQDALKKILENKAIDIPERNQNMRNIAAVMVSARIPAYARQGDSIDVWVSSVGDARSLAGGYLLQTALAGADGVVYAVAQGAINGKAEGDNQQEIPDENYREANRQKKKGSLRQKQDRVNTFHVPRAALIEKSVSQPLYLTDTATKIRYARLSLNYFDLLTARNIVRSINTKFKNSASLDSDGAVLLQIPEKANPPEFISSVLELGTEVPERTRVVLDTRNGSIVMGGDVGISKVSVSVNGITVRVKEKNDRESVKSISTVMLDESPTVMQLVEGLNKLGVGVADLIEILRAIHSAGALHAELVVL